MSLVLLDETTDFPDVEYETKILAVLSWLIRNKMVLFIARRMQTVETRSLYQNGKIADRKQKLSKLAVKSLAVLEEKLRSRGLNPMVITGHTGWHDDLDFVFAHRDQLCHDIRKQKPHDPDAPWDGYDESDDTEQKARSIRLAKQKWMK